MDKIIITLAVIFIVLMLMVFTSRYRIVKIYKKYLTQGNSKNITGYELALLAKEKLELDHLNFAVTDNDLADAYNPKTKTLIMSHSVKNYASLTSISVVAHEIGHAIQDKQNNRLFGLVHIFSKITRFTNKFIIPSLLAGFTLSVLGYFEIVNNSLTNLGYTLCYVGFALFLFHAITKLCNIPLEYDASKKALWFLKDYNIIKKSETKIVKRILSVAALTYIASLFDGIVIFSHKLRGFITKKNKKGN